MSDTLRSKTICISAQTHWALRMLARASHAKAGPMDTAKGTDAVAEEILSTVLAEQYPQLKALYEQRKDLDEQAAASLQTPLTPLPPVK